MLKVKDWRADWLERLLWEAGDARAADRLQRRLESVAWRDVDGYFLRSLYERNPDEALRAFATLLRRFPEHRADLLFQTAIADGNDVDWSIRDRGHEKLRRFIREATLAAAGAPQGGATCPAR